MSERDSLVVDGDFMCRCSDEDSAKADAVLARAKEIISQRSKLKDDLDFVDRAIVWLALDGEFGFAWDQWGCIWIKPFEKYPSKNIAEGFSAQCDRPIDGLAAAIVHYYGDVPS